MLAPIVLFVYNRPDHTKKTIESLSKNILAKESVIYIFSDAQKEHDHSNNVEQTREYISTLKEQNLFNDVIIQKSEKNKGLANSVIYGVGEIIKKHGKVIVLEDDLISHPNFLRFMNDALDFYGEYEDIWSISGYTIPISIPETYQDDVFISYRSSSWGWATWEKNWTMVDWNVKNYDNFRHNRKKRERFNRGGKDLSYLLDDQMHGKVDSWAIRWYYSQFINNKYTIYPIKSFIKNIGLDGSGTHSGKNRKYGVEINNKLTDNYSIKFVYPEFHTEINENFKNYYLSLKGKVYRKLKILFGR